MPFDGSETFPSHSPATAKTARSGPKEEPVPSYKTPADAAAVLWDLWDAAYRKGRPSTVPELPSAEEAVAQPTTPKAIPAAQRRASILAALTLITRIREQLDTIELKKG